MLAWMNACSGSAVIVLASIGLSRADSLGSRFASVDENGFRVVSLTAEAPPNLRPWGVPRAGTLFSFHDNLSIAASVSLGGSDVSWVGQELNLERLQTFDTYGDGSPLWEFSYDEMSPFYVGVAAAREADFALSVAVNAGIVEVRGFDSTSNVARWTYAFDSQFEAGGHHSVAVNRDGTVAAALAGDFEGSMSRLVILNPSDGTPLDWYDYAFYANSFFLTADGSRAILTAGASAKIIDMATGVEIFSVSASGSGGTHRMSADGTVFGVGGFNLKIYREIEGVFQLAHVENETTEWYGNALAFSADGHYAIAASFDYLNYSTLTYRIIDVYTDTELARTTTSGAGTFQDTLVSAAVNDEGTVFATASWGLINNDHPEVMIFDRDAEMIAGIDTPGSVFALDLSADGAIALCGAKSVHANTFGSGGDAVAYQVFDPPPPACDGDVNGDGAVDPLDSGFVLSRLDCPVGAGDADCDASDVNLSGNVDPLDVGYVLSRFGACK